jgi:hypothetical protein
MQRLTLATPRHLAVVTHPKLREAPDRLQATGGCSEPVDTSTGGGNLTRHQYGIQGSGLTRESMTGQPGTGHQFGEITDHTRR